MHTISKADIENARSVPFDRLKAKRNAIGIGH